SAGALAISAAALLLAGAKGGFGAAALGLASAALLWWAGRRERRGWTTLVGPLAVGLPLLAVVVRGLVGERIGELSILFRWFYTQGAARILGENWLHGVGPDGFQAAYAVAKNPLSPEDVTSPHSLLWDWAACLGIGGVLWGFLLLWAATRIGPSATDAPSDRRSPDGTRLLMRAACLIAALAAMLAIPTQYAALLPEEALGVRIGGLIIWCVISCAFIAVAHRWSAWPIGLAAGACVLLAHTQIEITGMWVQSCGALLAVVGLAAARPDSPVARAAAPGPLWPNVLAAGAMIATAVALAPTLSATLRWGAALGSAADQTRPLRELRRLVTASASRPAEQADYQRRLAAMEPGVVEAIIRTLPPVWPLTRSASQLALEESRNFAGARTPIGDRYARAWALRALGIVLDPGVAFPVEARPGEPLSNDAIDRAFEQLAKAPTVELDSLTAGWAATVAIGTVEWLPQADRQRLLSMADRFLLAAYGRDPYNPLHLQRLMDVRERLGDAPGAARAARDLLAVNELQRLDPTVRGLSEKDLARARRIAAAAP
ncbi:MAG TPA: O-antigen ligase family protein, partial [Phycisphaerales bacterium]|nr:O-antigen ligase family protein [Phycisphaerales bacterium]